MIAGHTYHASQAREWDQAVGTSRNGTFLLRRSFMDYHANRFTDHSLLFKNQTGHILGLLPAHIRPEQNLAISHGGLTYGGLVLSPKATLTDVREMLVDTALRFLAEGCRQLIYKPIPHIYHAYPTQEDLYWLFRAEAQLEARAVAGTIDLQSPLATTLWHRKTKKQACEGLQLTENGGHEALAAFWDIVCEVLASRHATRPVHSLDEITLLCGRFPDNITLFTVTNTEQTVIGGCLLFLAGPVAHVQYMEVGEEGRRRRALDWLMQRLIPLMRQRGYRYLDYGISTEQGGRYLNEGLAYQKEGFGGRAVCYDTYAIDLEKLASL